jgi:hypothetical protein
MYGRKVKLCSGFAADFLSFLEKYNHVAKIGVSYDSPYLRDIDERHQYAAKSP